MRNKHLKYILLLSVVIFAFASILVAQETMAVGQILDSQDKSPIANVNVFFKNTVIGVRSDNQGFFMVRTAGNETTLLFTCVGYKTKEIKLQKGKSVGMQVELQQENTVLSEIFVVPGANPAIPLMNRVRAARDKNNILKNRADDIHFTNQSVAFLGNVNKRNVGQKLFETLSASSLQTQDSTLLIPVFLTETSGNAAKDNSTENKKNTYKANEETIEYVSGLFNRLDTKYSFYNNYINILGLSFVSPVAYGSGTYYNFYLTDSTNTNAEKKYSIRFKSKNLKNQAFNGQMLIDSASAAILSVTAELPLQSNVNFVQQLKLTQVFDSVSPFAPKRNETYIRLNQNIIKDTTFVHPALFLKKTVHFTPVNDAFEQTDNFAQTGLSKEDIETKITTLNSVPLYKTAKYIANVLVTGYIPINFIDIGKIQQLARVNNVEGFRMTLPVKTNEKLLKNASLGGYIGYGCGNKEFQYSGSAEYLFPFKNRNLIRFSYTKDYRRTDYNYNNFLITERPLLSADDDISNTIFSFNSTTKLSLRKELEAQLNNEWSRDLETFLTFRRNELYAAPATPMQKSGINFNSVYQSSLQFTARLSFNERVYDRHTQRIYIQNTLPVVYLSLSGGESVTPLSTAYFGRMNLSVKQQYPFAFGSINYLFNASWQWGNVPYVLLDYPAGNEGGGYSFYRFNLMNYMEYAADRFAGLHTEIITNGILFNHIPLVNKLNLREVVSFKTSYGSLNSNHTNLMDLPASGIYTYNKPYAEAGIGITNILGIFMVQSVWRLTDLNHPGVSPWALKAAVRVTF